MRVAFFAIAAVFSLCSCISEQEMNHAQARYDECIAAGGERVYVDRVGPPLLLSLEPPLMPECAPALTEEQRQINLAALEFEAQCKAQGGFAWSDDRDKPNCLADALDAGTSCTTAADCSGTCVRSQQGEPQGMCSKSRPLTGCMSGYGAQPREEKCVE